MSIILIILIIVSILIALYSTYISSSNNKKLNRLRRRYDYLLRGRGEISMEELIGQFGTELESYKVIKSRDEERLRAIESWVQQTDTDQTQAIDDKFSILAEKLTSYVDTNVSNNNSNMKRIDENVYSQLEGLKKETFMTLNQGLSKANSDIKNFSQEFNSRIKKNEEENYLKFIDMDKVFKELRESTENSLKLESEERKLSYDKLSSLTMENLKAYQKQLSASMQGLDRRLSTDMNELKESNENRIKKLEDNTAQELKRQVSLLNSQISLSISKVGLTKYNAFEELSGNLSYSLAMLDEHKSGLILTGIYARERSTNYAKEVINGKVNQPLSPEEEEALRIALER